jgi:prepilin-type N-terminal cleavage/methylation domain-containing protein
MRNDQGFTLIETLVALIIFALISLMAGQGLSSSIRVKERVENQIKMQDELIVMMKYFKSDCETMLNNLDERLPPTITLGNKYVWLIRHYSSPESNGWQLIGYTLDNHFLKRYATDVMPLKQDTVAMYLQLIKDPDLGLAAAKLSYQLPAVRQQNIEAIWSPLSRNVPLGLRISLVFDDIQTPLTSSCLAEGLL